MMRYTYSFTAPRGTPLNVSVLIEDDEDQATAERKAKRHAYQAFGHDKYRYELIETKEEK